MKTITRDEVLSEVNEWNSIIEHFMQDELPELLKAEGVMVRDGKILMGDWFKAQYIIQRQDFYNRGRAIQQKLRSYGYDVKMNMQDHTLVLY